ncbi:MAG: hypothetical protein ACI8ZM_002551 [Crocinitomix sp.]|jgi:hypothetical protein
MYHFDFGRIESEIGSGVLIFLNIVLALPRTFK